MAVISGRGVQTGRAGGDVGSGRQQADVSQREDLANFISMITRDETPFMSSIGKTKATAIYHEWQLDTLQAPGNSVIGEGSDYQVPDGGSLGGSTTANTAGTGLGNAAATFNIIGPQRSRVGNYTQINGKTIAVSGTKRAIDQAGVADEYAYQLKKRGTELRRDLEYNLIHTYQHADLTSAPTGNNNTASNARLMGGVQAWINVSGAYAGGVGIGTVELNGATVSNPGTGRDAPTLTGSRVALSLSDIDSVMQRIYEEGGKASKIMLSPKLRRDFSDLMVTDSGVRRNIDMDGKLRQSVDIYMSDFGDLMVVPNYIMGLNNTQAGATGNPTTVNNTKDSMALIYDPMWFAIATLRPLQEVDVGQRGDSTIGMMVEECTLEVKNPIGCGAIYNLN